MSLNKINVEIFDFEITEEDKFMVIASDGVWEFISNEQVKLIFIDEINELGYELCYSILFEKSA